MPGLGSAAKPLLSNIVRLSLLEGVRPEYLLQFLRPFEPYLADKGVMLDGVALDHDWIGHLHVVLSAVDPAMPPVLQQALLDIAELASDEAHEQVLELAGERQLSLFVLGRELTAEDLAFKLYLEYGEFFAATQARVQSKEAQRFVEFFASGDAPLLGHQSEAKRVLLKDQLGRWFGTRNCTDYCDVRATEHGSEITFLVIHGCTPRSQGVITTEGSRGRTSFIPDSQDTLVFDKRTCRLSVSARWPAEQDFYRQAVGLVFFGNANHFLAHEVFTGAPILELGARALATTGILGLEEVVLQQLGVKDREKPSDTLTWRGRDLGPKLALPKAKAFFEDREITLVKMTLKLRGATKKQPVTVRPPNKVDYDRRYGDGVVREFLLRRGFMRLPAREELAVAVGG